MTLNPRPETLNPKPPTLKPGPATKTPKWSPTAAARTALTMAFLCPLQGLGLRVLRVQGSGVWGLEGLGFRI